MEQNIFHILLDYGSNFPTLASQRVIPCLIVFIISLLFHYFYFFYYSSFELLE